MHINKVCLHAPVTTSFCSYPLSQILASPKLRHKFGQGHGAQVLCQLYQLPLGPLSSIFIHQTSDITLLNRDLVHHAPSKPSNPYATTFCRKSNFDIICIINTILGIQGDYKYCAYSSQNNTTRVL